MLFKLEHIKNLKISLPEKQHMYADKYKHDR